MADSNITKRALASALKELMNEKPFARISVSDICTRCDMNRKSFYYHFKDKYDLVNWIYNTEFLAVVRHKDYESGWNLLEELCEYFYDNRDFYRRTFQVDGQNSFSDYFHAIAMTILTEDLAGISTEASEIEFYVNFYTDAFVCAIKRWLSEKDCMPAKDFSVLLKRCLLGVSQKIVSDFNVKP